MKKGFTLVEILVAIALFSVIVAVAAGGFTTALRTQREVAALIAAQSNAGLALEQVAREVRTGYLFCHDPASAAPNAACAAPHCSINGNVWTCDLLNFYNAAGAATTYSLAGGQLQRSDNGGLPQPITGANVLVKYATFTLFGNIEGDHWNPRITISMGVSPNSRDLGIANNVLNLQTTVSARAIDCGSPAVGC